MRNRLFLLMPDSFVPFEATFSSTQWLWPIEECVASVLAVPKDYKCKITQGIMQDPVVAKDGFTYEKNAIEEWIKKTKHLTGLRSPTTNLPISSDELVTNQVIKTRIREFIDKQKNKIKEIIKNYDQEISTIGDPVKKVQCLINKGIAAYHFKSLGVADAAFKQAMILAVQASEEYRANPPNTLSGLYKELVYKHFILQSECSLLLISFEREELSNEVLNGKIEHINYGIRFLLNKSQSFIQNMRNIKVDASNADEIEDINNRFVELYRLIGCYIKTTADFYFHNGNYDLALSSYDLALEGAGQTKSKCRIDCLTQIGKIFYNRKSFADAAERFEEVTTLDQNKAEYLLNMGKACFQLAQYEKAEGLFEAAYSLSNKSADLIEMRALSRLMRSMLQDSSLSIELCLSAISDYNAAILLRNSRKIIPRLHFQRGISYVYVALQLQKQRSEGINNASLSNTEKYIDLALNDVTLAIQHAPGNSHYYYARAFLYNMKKEKDRSLQDYNTAISNRECAEYYWARANVYYQYEQYDEAHKDFEKALSCKSGNTLANSKGEIVPYNKNGINILVSPDNSIEMNLIKVACFQKNPCTVLQLKCISQLVSLFYMHCPEVLINTLVDIYDYYDITQSGNKMHASKKDVFDAIFSALTNQINEEIETQINNTNHPVSKALKALMSSPVSVSSDQQIEMSSTDDPSQFERKVFEEVVNYLKTGPSIFQNFLQLFDEGRLNRLNNQAKEFKAIAIFCCLFKADEPLANLITRTFEKNNFLFSPHFDLHGFNNQYKSTTSKGLQDFGFISELRMQQHKDKMAKQEAEKKSLESQYLVEVEIRKREELGKQSNRKDRMLKEKDRKIEEEIRQRIEETRKREEETRKREEETRKRKEETHKREQAERLIQQLKLENESLKNTQAQPANSCIII